MQFFDLVLDNVGAPGWIIQIIMAVLALGFPVALVLAWAFDVPSDGTRVPSGSRKAFALLVAIVSLGAVGFVIWSFSGDTEPDAVMTALDEPAAIRSIDSIAVLPFESLSADQSDEYFADGLADTLLHKLAQLPRLKVIARNSTFQFKGTNLDAREIGEILDVATMLEGTVQRQGDQVRIIAQLIDTVDGRHIWSQTFDDTMANIFDLQDRIADAIMVELRLSISEQERLKVMWDGTDSPEAFDLLMRATQRPISFDRRQFDPDTDEVLALIDGALEIDPEYAAAWASRANYFSGALFTNPNPARAAEYIQSSRDAAQRAVDANPDYAGGYEALAGAEFRAGNDPEARRLFIKAIELNPSSVDAMRGLGLATVETDPQAALDLFRQAREIDPQFPFVYRQIYFSLAALGRWNEAIESLEEGIQRFPNHPILLSDIVAIYLTRISGSRLPPHPTRHESSKTITAVCSVLRRWLRCGPPSAMQTVQAAWLALFADRFPSSPETISRQYAIEVLRGDPRAALAIVESVPSSPSFRFDRSTRIGGACLLLDDAPCKVEQADIMQGWLDELIASGQDMGARERYELAITVLRNAAIDDSNARDSSGMRSWLEESNDWPVTGGRGARWAGYLRVMLYSLLDDDDAAVAELVKTLEFEDNGFLYRDIFRIPPDLNPLIVRLQNSPGYDEWMTAFEGRRESARGQLFQMERDGEILSAADVVP